jgi:hypothetical protein
MEHNIVPVLGYTVDEKVRRNMINNTDGRVSRKVTQDMIWQ